MPHRTTETLIRICNMEAALTRLVDSSAGPVGDGNAEDLPTASTHVSPTWPPPVGEVEIYRGYTDKDLELLRRYAALADRGAGTPGFIVDFLGTRTRTSYIRGIEGLGGTVRGLPVPDDGWHADAVEWVGLLKSVDQARGGFAAMELGAGWGPWVVSGARAAQLRGIGNVQLCAVEADPGHYSYLVDHFRNNGIDPTQHALIAAAVGVTGGTARWPKILDASTDWGSRPQRADESGNTDHVGRSFKEWLDVRIVAFGELLEKQPVWDLVHIDVQGWEVELCDTEGERLDARVKWLVVGTHDSKLHGDLMDQMFHRGWCLENEKPPRSIWRQGAPSLLAMTTHDGTQVWRNPAFAAPA
jgi:FkbM family methyltransferase